MPGTISSTTPLLPYSTVVGGHSGPRATEASKTMYLKAGDGFIGSSDGYRSIRDAEQALRSLTAGPAQGAALIVEHEGRYYGQAVFGLDVTGAEVSYDLEHYATIGKVDAGIFNSSVRMIIDGQQTLRRP